MQIRFNLIFIDFYECHNRGCYPQEEIIDVYMTNSNISDKQILENGLNDKEKIYLLILQNFHFSPLCQMLMTILITFSINWLFIPSKEKISKRFTSRMLI